MKISASIYSRQDQSLAETIRELDERAIDLFHIDCNDNPEIFSDVEIIRQISQKPIDLHLITPQPEQYFEAIQEHDIEYVTFQYENLNGHFSVPANIKSMLGLAITSDTDISVFEKYADQFDFILFMTTVPGKSGGIYNKENFRKIRQFRMKFPGKNIHVDGGVNAEVSFILRNMGVNVAVSGSYLFKTPQISDALLHLKNSEMQSHYQIKDFMQTLEESPYLKPDQRSLKDILYSIENYRIGFTMLIDNDMKLEGIISNADLRRGLIRHVDDDLNKIKIENITNHTPLSVNENSTVREMLRKVKQHKSPVSYLPVVDDENCLKGVVVFIYLVKGEA